MDEIAVTDDIKIEDMIYEVRGKQVMLDFNLAQLYECKNGAKSINLAVKRHINRFPERFMFQLTDEEFNNLRFQFETSSLDNVHGGRRYNPYAFTEQGIYMLMTVLKGKLAIEQSKALIRIFKGMKYYLVNNNIKKKAYSASFLITSLPL